ncbi:MAG: type II toxin-antitoxin system PemK/MazF family toxin [Candidatus Hydrogenedentes bacterium]|nr:type II toxin-antitoxin system PemK/MazF family toxin [Candidatus Hydrogenedentota bacterium]
MLESGDVVLVVFPGAVETKKRPAVVLSSAAYHAERPDVIVGILTSRVDVATKSTDHVLLDWEAAGLRLPSAYRCYLAMVPAKAASTILGRVTSRDWNAIRACLRLAFGD